MAKRIVTCNCGQEMTVSEELLGQSVTCVNCGREVVVSEANSRPAPPEVPVARGTAPTPPPIAQAQVVPPTVPVQAPAQRSGMPTWVIVLIIAVPLLFMFLACAGIFAAIMLPALSRAREAAQRASCQNNLKQFGVVFKMHAGENEGYYPALSYEPGRIMFSEEVYPEYFSDPAILLCPSDPDSVDLMSFPAAIDIDDYSYFYLSHVVTNETEGLAFVDAYRERAAGTQGFDEDFMVPDGTGNNGGSVLFRVKERIERELSVAQAQIPVMVDRDAHHIPGGGNVLFMDGHVEFLRFGRFPMTQTFLDALKSLDELGPP